MGKKKNDRDDEDVETKEKKMVKRVVCGGIAATLLFTAAGAAWAGVADSNEQEFPRVGPLLKVALSTATSAGSDSPNILSDGPEVAAIRPFAEREAGNFWPFVIVDRRGEDT